MPDKTILIFGGNGFIGAECVEAILNTFGDNEYRLILVNRGNWDDWDTESRIKSRIHENIIFDRDSNKSLTCTSLSDYLTGRDDDFKFDAIVDFSGFKRKHVHKVCQDIPAEKIKLYIYISTDSVYEVSQLKPGLNRGSLESDAVRPDSEEERKRLKKLDKYAHDKLKCEELLIEKSRGKFPYVFLRLPDVLGQRDSSNRFWQLQMQLEYLEYLNPGQSITIEISRPFYDLKTSYVDVKDVAKLVVYFLKSDIKNEIFNVGFDSPITLIELYKIIAKLVKPGLERRLEFVPTERTIYHPFPSVTRGPVSIHKLRSRTGFESSNIEDVCAACVQFNRQAFFKYPKMRHLVEKELKKDLNLTSELDKQNFENFIRDYKGNS